MNTPPPRLSRREVLELAAATGLTAALSAKLPRALAQTPPPASQAGAGAARNVIFMISDGTSLGGPSLLEHFSQRVRGQPSRWHTLMQDPAAALGLVETHSLSSIVTDSAAAATAYASGARVFNGALNMLPDGTKLTPLCPLARQTGRRTGLVTTTTITHATPAGFAAVIANRGDEPAIAIQYLDAVDVLLGGGRPLFDAKHREDKRDLRGEFATKGYALWEQTDQMHPAKQPDRVLGLFCDGQFPFVLDQRSQPAQSPPLPSLADMTRAALDVLSAGPQGFFLMVEGGRPDHGAHSNDAAAMLWELIDFDDAIAAACAFAQERRDTLVVITVDHGTGTPALNGIGGDYRDSARGLERLAKATASYEAAGGRLAPQGDQPRSADDVRETVKAAFGVEITPDEAAFVRDAAAGKPPLVLNHSLANFGGVLGQVLGNHTGMGWTGTAHTADYVLLSAYGVGATQLAGLHRNIDVFERVATLMGITHRNPRMSPEDARKYLACAPVIREPHWA